ncbi:hypothetical protein ACFYNW_34160 [Streptomyces virginiae]|uniref:hypothetical protein n=1 Tax=Streptomyces virginiae TaxID=1961 RepID=UPI0036E2C517
MVLREAPMGGRRRHGGAAVLHDDVVDETKGVEHLQRRGRLDHRPLSAVTAGGLPVGLPLLVLINGYVEPYGGG